MIEVMKKTFRFVFAAVAVLAAASCTKEYIETLPEVVNEANLVTFTVSINDDATKTALASGKTVWAAGDSLLLTDGSKKCGVSIPADYVGTNYAQIKIDTSKIDVSKTLYAVYPYSAYSSVASGVVSVKVGNDQSGNFDEANICVAKSDNYNFALKNAASILKFSVPEGIETVVLSASAADTLAGTLAVTYPESAEDAPVIAKSSPVKSIKVVTGGLDGTFYVAVIPGEYKEFTMTALTLQGKVQKKKAENKSLPINAIADLGLIGDDLSGATLEGEGTEDAPFLIKDLADITTLASLVNSGLSYSGQYFLATNDISDISTPIGTYDQVDIPFQGLFNGADHKFTLAMGNEGCTDSYLGLFGCIGDGAVVTNVIVNGSITTTGSFVGGIAARVSAGKEGTSVVMVSNNAVVKGAGYVGGIVGFATSTVASKLKFNSVLNAGAVTGTSNYVGGIFGAIYSAVPKTAENCKNEATITGLNGVGGISGLSYFADFDNCNNYGEVVSTQESVTGCLYNFNAKNYTTGTSGVYQIGTGGITGSMQNGSVKNCSNGAPVTGYFKVGGITGVSYWGLIETSENNGTVTGTGGATSSNPSSQTHFSYGSLAGGIVGWARTQSTIKNCTNAGEVASKGGAGGIVGYYYAESGKMGYITDCKNSGKINTVGAYFGGVAGINPSTGGIAGKVTAVGGSGRCVISGCENTGEVVNNSYNTGGIIGEFHCATTGSVQEVYKCVNKGNVTGPVYTGGIVGFCYSAYKQTSTIKNCANYGTIKSIRSSDGGDCAGGILGANHVQNDNVNYVQTINIYNCYNQGNVVYPSAHVKPYTGGIVGRWEKAANAPLSGKIGNTYNSGFIGPENEEAPAAGAENYLGNLVGSFEYAGTMNFSYYSAGACDENITAVGKASKAIDETVTSYDEAGELGAPVVVNEVTCLTLLEALNQWQNLYVKYDYFNWKAGANGPEFDTTTD